MKTEFHPYSPKQYWLETFGKKGLCSVDTLTCYKPQYRKSITLLYNVIKYYELLYEGWGRKIFCRELSEKVLDLIEYGCLDICNYKKNNIDKSINKNMKENRILYQKFSDNKNRKWYEFWKDRYIIEKYTLKLNKKGEIVLGILLTQ